MLYGEKQKAPAFHRSKREGIEIRAVVLAHYGSTRNARSRPTASVGAGDYFQDWKQRRDEQRALTELVVADDTSNPERGKGIPP